MPCSAFDLALMSSTTIHPRPRTCYPLPKPSYVSPKRSSPARLPLPPERRSPPSPVTPTATFDTYLPELGTILHEPWNLRVKYSSSPHPFASRAQTPILLSSSSPSSQSDSSTNDQHSSCPFPPYSYSTYSSHSASSTNPPSHQSAIMSSGALKRKVVIMGAPSVGELHFSICLTHGKLTTYVVRQNLLDAAVHRPSHLQRILLPHNRVDLAQDSDL